MGKVLQFPRTRRAKHIEGMKRALRRAVAELGEDLPFEKREVLALELTNEATREALEEDLQEVAESFPERVRVRGQVYGKHCERTGVYRSLCGDLVVRRHTYRRVDWRNGPTIVPLELEAGLVEKATPALARSLALGYAKGPIRHWEEDLQAAARCPPPRASAERLAKKLGTKMKARTVEVEPVVRKREHVPDGAHAVCISLDRTSAPMEEPRAPGARPKTRRKRRARPYVRKPPHPVDVNFRMVYVGSVTIVDHAGEALVKRSYGATAAEGPEEILIRMMDDVKAVLAERSDLLVAVIQDGAAELWGWMWDMLRIHLPDQKVHQLIDWYHMMEHVSRALHLLEPDARRRQVFLDESTKTLRKYRTGAQRLADWLLRQKPARKGAKYQGYYDQISYIDGFGERTNYAKFLHLGLPIGSGPNEGACKFLVAGRAKRSGQRWHEEGLAAALTLRALYYSERLDSYWNVFRREYREIVRPAA